MELNRLRLPGVESSPSSWKRTESNRLRAPGSEGDFGPWRIRRWCHEARWVNRFNIVRSDQLFYAVALRRSRPGGSGRRVQNGSSTMRCNEEWATMKKNPLLLILHLAKTWLGCRRKDLFMRGAGKH